MSRYTDAEQSVLGACLLSADAYWRVADLLNGDDFSRSEHRDLWERLSGLIRAGDVADAVTVGDRFPEVATLAIELANASFSAANVRAYAEIVQREAITRRVRASGQRIAKLAGDDSLGEAQRILASCAPRMASDVKPVREFLKESIALMAARCEQTEVLTGVPTSLDWMDETLSGWQRGDLILIGARPSVGKTALAVQASLHAAQQGHPVLFLSLEMAGAQLTDRMLAHLSGIDGQMIRQPKRLEEVDWPRITKAGADLGQLPIRIDETSALTIEGVCARIRQANATQRLGLVVIDYLTQVVPPKAEKLTDGIQVITRTLKALAKELKLPIILLSQLNRAGDHKPSLTSLRESGAIEQDADVVILMHRPDDARRDLICANVAKQRNGPTSEAYLHFNGANGRFVATDEKPGTVVPIRRQAVNRFIERSLPDEA